jgi:hypothetical protein
MVVAVIARDIVVSRLDVVNVPNPVNRIFEKTLSGDLPV